MISRRYLLIMLGFCWLSYGQQVDSLAGLSLQNLEEKIIANREQPAAYTIYSNAFMNRAKAKKDSLQIAKGFYFLKNTFNDFSKKLQYLDSAILYTKNLKNDSYPARFYLAKGTLFYYRNEFLKALDNYVLAEKAAKNQQGLFYYDAKFNIGLLQRTIGDYESAEQTFLECLAFETIPQKRHNVQFQLSSIYYESGQYAKSTAMNQMGISETLNTEQLASYYHFVINEGINLSLSNQHMPAIDSIKKALPHLYKEDQLVGKFYLGKSYHAIGKRKIALNFFKAIDTAFNNREDILLPLRNSYVYLIKDAKQKDDKVSQLYYMNQLLKLDSIHHTQYKELSQTIVKDYDIPQLIEEKERIIEDLQEDSEITNKKLHYSIAMGILVSFLGVLLLFYNYSLRQKYEKRFNAIVKQTTVAPLKETIATPKITPEDSIGLDNAAIEAILKKLALFEKEKQYLTNQISLHDVAKIVKTNSKYLSKIINSYKNKTFTNYINDLRVAYTIDRIQNDEMYKKYTIKAIAQEAGFTNSGAYLRAFYKKTGLKPSYFIKKVRAAQEK